MKKLICLAVLGFFTLIPAQAQFTAGVHGGLPLGDADDLATFAIAVELGYLFEISDNFSAGPSVGISHSFTEDVDTPFGPVEIDDVTFLPISGAARFGVSDNFTLGGDIGYAVGINDGNDGGFYYSPRVQYSVSDLIDLVLAYRGISVDGGSWDILSLGVEFGID
jgi:hypothetical protein